MRYYSFSFFTLILYQLISYFSLHYLSHHSYIRDNSIDIGVEGVTNTLVDTVSNNESATSPSKQATSLAQDNTVATVNSTAIAAANTVPSPLVQPAQAGPSTTVASTEHAFTTATTDPAQSGPSANVATTAQASTTTTTTTNTGRLDSEECTCGCGLDTKSAKAQSADTKRGKVDWCHEIQSHPDVYMKKYATLCKFGKGIRCNLCAVFVRMRRDFDTSNWDSTGGHISGIKHGEKETARRYREAVDERERLKAQADGIVVLPKKPKAQSSLLGLFKKTASKEAASPASNTQVTSPASNTRVTTGSKSCEGIIPRKFGYGKKLAMMNTYAILSPTANYTMGELIGSGTFNLYAKTCKGAGIIRTRKTCPGIRCDDCQGLWTTRSTKLKLLVDKRGGSLLTMERCLNAPVLSEDDAVTMKQFINNNISLWFKKAGQDLHAMVKHRVQFYEKVKVCFTMLIYALNLLDSYSDIIDVISH